MKPTFSRAAWARAAALGLSLLLGLINAPNARANDPQSSFGSSIPGITYDSWNNVSGQANTVMSAMNAAGLSVGRIGTSYNRNNTNADMDSYLLAVHAHNITPYLLVEYYGYYGDIANGTGNVYSYWKTLGQNMATRYQPNSTWLKSQNISNWGITYYSAFNEPDMPIDGNGNLLPLSQGIPINSYVQALQGFADGIHSVNASLKVIPGGFARPNAYPGDNTGGGYISALASLFNNGTLDGVDLHLYSGGTPTGAYGPMAVFRGVKSGSGITADINHYCTEFNYDDDSQSVQTQGQWLLTEIWAHLAVNGNGTYGANNLKSQVELAFDIGTLRSQAKWGLTQSFNPWVPTVPGQTMQFVAQQVKGLHFTDTEPWDNGYNILDGTVNGQAKRMWVIENHAGWAQNTPKASFTCSGIPAGSGKLLVYGWDGYNGPRQTINLTPGQTSATISGLVAETYMVVSVPSVPSLGHRISLKAKANGQYVSAANATNALIANSTSVGTNQEFDVVATSGGQIALKAVSNGQYVTAKDGWTNLFANSSAIGAAQTFSWISNSDGTISLQSAGNNQYVTADNYGQNPLIANRTSIGSWEEFNWGDLGATPSTSLFYTGFESGDVQPTWLDSVDSSNSVSGYNSGISPECSPRTSEQAVAGNTAEMYSGTANATSAYCYYKTFSVNIPVASNTRLQYFIYPQQDNGRYVGVDLHCTDGSTLRDSGALDSQGKSFHPNAGHGGNIPLNQWTQIEGNIGSKLAGKTIDKIWVAFDRVNGPTGQYRGYIDNITLANSDSALGNSTGTVSIASVPQGGDGVSGAYYSGTNFNTLVKTQTDPNINFAWGSSLPITSAGANGYSVRWTGSLKAVESGDYLFSTQSSDGVRVWINGQLVIDNWMTQPSTVKSGKIELAQGQKYALKVEFFRKSGEGVVRLAWQRPGQSKAMVIPQSQLYTSVAALPQAIPFTPQPADTQVPGAPMK